MAEGRLSELNPVTDRLKLLSLCLGFSNCSFCITSLPRITLCALKKQQLCKKSDSCASSFHLGDREGGNAAVICVLFVLLPFPMLVDQRP